MDPLHKASTPLEINAAVQELMDGGNVLVTCGEHHYYPVRMGIENTALQPPRHLKCKHCWEAYYLVYFMKLPPHVREQRLDEALGAVAHANEAAERGEFSFKPYRHPEINIEEESE